MSTSHFVKHQLLHVEEDIDCILKNYSPRNFLCSHVKNFRAKKNYQLKVRDASVTCKTDFTRTNTFFVDKLENFLQKKAFIPVLTSYVKQMGKLARKMYRKGLHLGVFEICH